MKKSFLTTFCIFQFFLCLSQDIYSGKECKIHFLSKTPLEDIEAKNKHAVIMMNTSNGAVQVQVQIKAFKFKSSFMEEHFNENYMESEKYPFSTFKGKINEKIDYSKDGEHKVTCTGKLEIHGVTQEVTIAGTLKIKGKEIILDTKFKVKPADYKIDISGMYVEKIAKEIDVDLEANMEPFKK